MERRCPIRSTAAHRALVHHRRRQEFEVADLELGASSTRTTLRFKYGSKSSLFFKSSTLIPSVAATLSSSCGDSSVWICPPDSPAGYRRRSNQASRRIAPCCAGSKRRDQPKTRAAFWARAVPHAPPQRIASSRRIVPRSRCQMHTIRFAENQNPAEQAQTG